MSRAPQESDSAVDRLLKLLPAESTAAFLILRTQFPYDPNTDGFLVASYTFYLLTLIILVATPFLIYRVWDEKDRFTIVFITISFVIWALNIDIQRTVHFAQVLHLTSVPILPFLLSEEFINGLMVVWAIVLVPLALPKSALAMSSTGPVPEADEKEPLK